MQHTAEHGFAKTVIDHVGFAVPDLGQAIDFFIDVLGFRVETQFDPVCDPGDDYMSRTFDIHPRSAYRGAFIITRAGQRIELTQWETRNQDKHVAGLADMSSRHIAFSVDDLEQSAEYLARQSGVDVFDISPHGFFYFRTSWGMYLQAVQSRED